MAVVSITDAVDSGTTREQLVALRRVIAKAIDHVDCPPRDLASLSRRLMDITAEIDAIDALDEGEADADSGATEDEAWEPG